MITYERFETLGEFTLLRPIFFTILIAIFLLFLIVLFSKPQHKLVNGFSITGLSFFSILIAAQLLYYEGIIVDEINLGGDEVSTYMFIAIVALGFLNPIIYIARNQKIE